VHIRRSIVTKSISAQATSRQLKGSAHDGESDKQGQTVGPRTIFAAISLTEENKKWWVFRSPGPARPTQLQPGVLFACFLIVCIRPIIVISRVCLCLLCPGPIILRDPATTRPGVFAHSRRVSR
jgi:hypothetical protein